MDLLKWLLMLPWRVVRWLTRLLGAGLRPVLGDVSWGAPGWMHVVRRHPRRSGGAVLALVGLALAGWFGWQWYQHRPRPQQMTFEVTAPAVTDYSQDTPVIQPLVVTFSGSAAPIEQVDKAVTEGISSSPAVKGQWKWTDDRTLVFTPAADWPVGQKYTVRLDPRKLLAPQVHLAEDHFDFATEAFTATLGEGEFYQDPQNASAKQVIQKLDFNYPVDPAQLEKRISLSNADAEGKATTPVKFSVTYDKNKLHAWIHSQQLALPHDPGLLLVNVDDGVTSSRGGDGTRDALHARVRIPGLYSLTVDDIRPTLVDDDRNEPQQVLVLNFNGAVRTDEVAPLVHAWVLPNRKPGQPDSGDDRPYPWSVSQVGADVLRQSQVLPLTATPTEENYQALQSFGFHAQPGQRIYVRIDKGLKSFGGYVQGQPVARVITVPDYPQLLRFVGSGSLLSMSGSKRISVVSRNLPGMRLVVGRVLPEQLQHLVSLNQGDYSHPELMYGFSEDQIVERQVIKQGLPDASPAKASYTGVDLGKYLADGKRGVFLLHLGGYDPAIEQRATRDAARRCTAAKQRLAPAAGRSTNTAASAGIPACDPVDESAGSMDDAPTDSRLIVVTDLGMLVKKADDGSQDVFVQSIHGGEPVAGATVAVVAVNGKTLLSRTTGADGMASFPSLSGFDHDRRPVMYLVTRGADMSFLPIGASGRELDYS
ncbi:MAG: Ig-like domain-containing protein, partial [Rhodanobacter sp.]